MDMTATTTETGPARQRPATAMRTRTATVVWTSARPATALRSTTAGITASGAGRRGTRPSPAVRTHVSGPLARDRSPRRLLGRTPVAPGQRRPQRPGSPEPVALARPETARALVRYRMRAGLTALAGLMGLAAAVLLLVAMDYPQTGPWAWLWTILAGCSLLPLLTGGVGIVTAARMRRVLARGPWVACAARVREAVPGDRYGQAVLVLLPPARSGGAPFVLTVSAAPRNWPRLYACDGGAVWFCGEPSRGGVVSPPGGDCLLWVRPAGLNVWWRRRTAAARRAAARATHTNPAGA